MKDLRRGPGGFGAAAAAFDRISRMSRLCLILFGSPGSGKGTQAKLLKQAFDIAHISTGDMLRERVASRDKVGQAVASLMQAGELVPDEVVAKLVEERIEQPDCVNGFILDG